MKRAVKSLSFAPILLVTMAVGPCRSASLGNNYDAGGGYDAVSGPETDAGGRRSDSGTISEADAGNIPQPDGGPILLPDAGNLDGSFVGPDSVGIGDGGIPHPCTVGEDQKCNEDPTVNSLLGTCQPDGTCSCRTGLTRSPYTGRCLLPGDTTGEGCEYGGVVYGVGATFKVDCNTCTCYSGDRFACTTIDCATPNPVCAFDAIYVYGMVGGLVAYQDTVYLTPPTSYLDTRIPSNGGTGISCTPALPPCATAGVLDVSDIMADLADPDVVRLLAGAPMSPPLLLGVDTRPFDGAVFSFQRGDGHGFLVGAPCSSASSGSCVDIPAGVSRLVSDLQALDRQQLSNTDCAR